MGDIKNRYAKLKDRARRSANNVEERDAGSKKKFFFLNYEDKDIVGEKQVEFYKPKFTKGRNKNNIDILPYPITSDWYKEIKAYNGDVVGLEPGDLDYKLEVAVHTIGPITNKKQFLCLRESLGQECPICQEMFEFYKKENRTDEDKKYADSLQPRWRVFYNVYDYAEPDKGIQIMEMAFNNFEKYLMLSSGLSTDGIDDENDDDPIYFFDLQDGMTLQFSGIKESFGDIDYVVAKTFDFVERDDPYDESVIDETYPLDKMMHMPTYQEISDVFSNQYEDKTVEEEPEENEEEPEEKVSDVVDTPEDFCPEGGTFGKDCNALEECKDCDSDIFDKCSDAQLSTTSNRSSKKRSFGKRVA